MCVYVMILVNENGQIAFGQTYKKSNFLKQKNKQQVGALYL